MSPRLVVRPQVEREINAAAQWYEALNPLLAADFLHAIDGAVEAIVHNPRLYQRVYKQKRRIILNRFPYALIFAIHEQTVVILACVHQRRNPAIWQNRQ